ncbi:hypothetical protein AB0L49_36790 [Streptomyces antimycoticus]|uniref:hypothetical protein n=1 Tax=Streptomyces TaxID=1883 RepID=UPI0034422173
MPDWWTHLDDLRSRATDLALVSGDFDDRGLDSKELAVDGRVVRPALRCDRLAPRTGSSIVPNCGRTP